MSEKFLSISVSVKDYYEGNFNKNIYIKNEHVFFFYITKRSDYYTHLQLIVILLLIFIFFEGGSYLEEKMYNWTILLNKTHFTV